HRFERQLLVGIEVAVVGTGQDGRAVVQVEGDVVLKVDGSAEILAGRHHDCAAAAMLGGVDGRLDGGRILGGPISAGAEVPNIQGRKSARSEEKSDARQS